MRAVLLLSVVCLTWPMQQGDGASRLFAADRAFCEATTADGLEGWLGWFAPDAFVSTPTGEVRSGPDQLRAFYRSMGIPPPGFSWEPESAELAASGDLGYTIGSWEVRPPEVSPPGVPEPLGGKYLTVWKRQPDGAYRVVTDLGERSDFRTRLVQADGPPLEWSCTTERFELAESGELAYAFGSWSARTASSERAGRFLTVWKRTPDGAWEVAAEIGFDL